jgi:hypothetical protein
MEYKVIIVDSEPYCIWESDISEQNRMFLDGIDTGYFEYILDSHIESNPDKEIPYIEQVRASVLLRSTYHHAMETMFSLLGALLQSPECTYAWMIKCKNIELVNVIKRISVQDNTLHHELKIDNVSWKEIAKIVFLGVEFEGQSNEKTSSQYGTLWKRLAEEYCDKNKTLEYNSIKHGLRINSGGHSFSFGLQSKAGEPAKQEDMTVFSNSNFGSSFIKMEPSNTDRGNRSLISKKVTLGWEIENIVGRLNLITSSIKNIVLRLKHINNCKITDEQYCKPLDSNEFDNAWKIYQTMSNMEMRIFNEGSEPITTTRKQLLEAMQKLKTKS